MPKVSVGEKQTCPQCGSKFYDLTRRPAVCPKCAFSFDPEDEAFKARKVKARAGGFNPADEDDASDAEEKVKVKAGDDDDDDAEPEAELEEVVDDAPEGTLMDDDDEVVVNEEDDLGDGFSEDVEVEDAEDDSVPFLEDDDDADLGEEIGDIGGDDDDR